MKTTIAAFALLLMAGAAPQALAQERDRGHEPRSGDADRPHDAGLRGGEHVARPAAAQPPVAPQAQQAPSAPQPRQNLGGRWGGGAPQPQSQDHQGQPQQPGRWQGRPPGQVQGPPQGQTPTRPSYEDGRRFVRRPGTWVDQDGDSNPQGLSPADRADQEDRDELRQYRRFHGDPAVQGDPRRLDRRGQDPRDGARRDGDHRPGDRRDGDRQGRPEWRPDAYPHAYPSQHRFHVRDYRRPPHFFVRAWGFGDVLPPTWYGPEYMLADWWDYDLPAPPYGYAWVRVGDDALLVDGYSGRVVQVVRALFW